VPQHNARILVAAPGLRGGLSKDKLVATLDGQPVAIEDVRPANDEPLVFAILLDVSGSAKDKWQFEERSVLALFQGLSNPTSVGYYDEFSDEVFLSPKPSTVESIRREFGETGRFRGGTAFYDALIAAAKQVNKIGGDSNKRRAVIVLSDGEDNSSRTSFKQTITELQQEAVPVFCIGLLGPRSSDKLADRLQTISQATGAVAFLMTGATDFVPRVVQQIQNQYWVITAAPSKRDRKLHRVTVTGADLQININAPSAIPIR
jgi:hypothetical protein